MSGSMNYIGSISILDRGDAPAQAIMDRNARSLAQRVADETRDELNKVMSRVHTIYGAMETVEEVYPTSANMEYLNDLAELEAILKDEIKKRQYQQQVTVFIVGYQDVCHQKLRLLQQVNEFFMENSKNIDEEDWFPTTPDIDLDEVTDTVEESLSHAHDLTVRLAELNREMVDYMATLAEKKASNKGRKKIEKALQQAKDEVTALSDKLMTLQADLDQREEKVQNVQKMMDMKNLELQKFRTAAELGKQATEEMDEMKKQLVAKEAKILAQRQQLSKMEVELAQSNHLKDRTEMQFMTSDGESQQKLVKLQKELDEQKASYNELKDDMSKLLDNQIHALHESHRQELEELKKEQETSSKEHKEELESLKQQYAQTQHDLITLQLDKREPEIETPSEVARIFDLVDSDPSRQTSRQSSKQESRPSTKDTRASGKTAGGKGSKSPTRQTKTGGRASGGKSDSKEYAEVAIQDEGGDPDNAVVDDKIRTPGTRHSKRARSTLDPVAESDLDNAFDLFDEDSWSAVAGDQMSGKFAQYRRLSKHRLLELEEQLQLMQAKTKRKVQTLKAQFHEHKTKWEAERKILIEQVDQSLRLQSDAEKEADAAMTQLEDFITEQERLEQEEEVKRGEILQASVSLTSQEGLTPPQRSLGATPDATATPGQVMLTPESEQELQRLMQQTDDAKSARQGVSSTSTRASSSGSVQVGTLLDVTRPVNQKQPSRDTTPSTQAVSPDAAVAGNAGPAATTTTSPHSQHSQSPTVRIESTQHDVSESVLNEVGLAICAETGHVITALKSPDENNATPQQVEQESVMPFEKAATGLLTAIEAVTFAVAGVDITAVHQAAAESTTAVATEGSPLERVNPYYPPSGQPLPGSVVTQQQQHLKSGVEKNLNPVVLIIPGGLAGREGEVTPSNLKKKEEDGSDRAVGVAAPDVVGGGVVEVGQGGVTAAATTIVATGSSSVPVQAQALIPGSEELAENGADLDIEIIAQKDVQEVVRQSIAQQQLQQQQLQQQQQAHVSPRGRLPHSAGPSPASSVPPSPQPFIPHPLPPTTLPTGIAPPSSTTKTTSEEPATEIPPIGAHNIIDNNVSVSGVVPSALDLVNLMTRKPAATSKSATPAQSRPVTGKGVGGVGAGVPGLGMGVNAATSREGSAAAAVIGLDGISIDVSTPRPSEGTQQQQQQVQELNARLGTCVSAPPAVDVDATANVKDFEVTDVAEVTEVEQQRSKTAVGTKQQQQHLAPLAQTVTVKLSHAQEQLSKSATPIAMKITNKNTGEVQIREVVQGTILPIPPPPPPSTTSTSTDLIKDAKAAEEGKDNIGGSSGTTKTQATTFMTPEGKIILTAEPIPLDDGLLSTEGLTPIEIHGDNAALSRSQTGISLPPPSHPSTPSMMISSGGAFPGAIGQGSPHLQPRSLTDPALRIRISPCPSPTKQGGGVGFPSGGAAAFGDPSTMISPRSSRLRRSRTGGDLAVVMESSSSLGPIQESAMDMMKRMMTADEDGLKPKQLKALESMRSAVKAIEARDSLSDEEIARTLTVLTLASQMSHEAFQLGVKPDSIFRSFSHMTAHSLSQLVPPKPMTSPGRFGGGVSKSHPQHQQPSTGFEAVAGGAREATKDTMTRETTLASVLEVDAENAGEEENEKHQKLQQEAEVDLSQLKELPLLDIVDTKPSSPGGYVSKPPSGYLLPSEATVGSSFQDQLETPLADLIQGDDPMKLLKESEQEAMAKKGGKPGGGELMDDGSNLEKARSNVTTEREATDATFGGAESTTNGVEGLGGGSGFQTQQNSTLGGAGGSLSKQPTDVSMVANAQGSFMAKSMSSLEGMKIEGMTEEEIRESSAHSRASLRSVYKVKLEETKSAAEERRSKSPSIHLPTQMTIDAELILDEDDDDDEDALDEMFKDPSMYEIGTSPPPGMSRDNTLASHQDRKLKGGKQAWDESREPTDFNKQPVRPVQKIVKKGQSLLTHPLLQEYLKTYQSVVTFRDTMGKMFLDKDMMSAHQMTTDLETLTFDKGQKAMPQVELLTKNAYYVLEEISSLITNILVYDREPPVSSLMHFSREATQKSFSAAAPPLPPPPPPQLPVLQAVSAPAESLTDSVIPVPAAPPGTIATVSRSSSKANVRTSSATSDKIHIRELQDQYNTMKDQLTEDKKNHHDQLQHNTVVMMGMQDTINDLQRELSALGKAAAANKHKSGQRSKPQSSSSHRAATADKPLSPEATIMFTRLDSERNAKIMKKAVHEDKMNSEKYKEAVSRMDEYVSLPAQRLAHLVKKYVHHSHMREIEENVKKSSSIDEEVFDVLDKMETLQNQRARQWAERMDEMGIERLRLANLLMTTLDNIELESGIFLIKPMYSYRGRDMKATGPQGKLSRHSKSQHSVHHRRVVTPSNDAASTFIPAPTPASNYRLVKHERHFLHQQQQQAALVGEMKPVDLPRSGSESGKEVKVMGSGLTFSASSPRMTWNMQASHPWTGKEDPNSFNTPRILELDINRMMIGQNNISSRVPFPPTEDRLVNASQNSLRSYVTVNRPTATFGVERAGESRGGQDGQRPVSTPRTKRVRVSETDKDIPASLETTPPLPPITPTLQENTSMEEEEEGEGDVRPPSVAFSNEEEGDDDNDEDDDDEREDSNVREPPQSPPGSSMYQSVTHRNEEGDAGNKNTRTPSGYSLSEDD